MPEQRHEQNANTIEPRTPTPTPSTPFAKANVGAADGQTKLWTGDRRRGKRVTVNGPAKYRTLKAIMVAINEAGIVPLDERLKSIIASQIGALLKGGFPEELVTRIGVELALAWDERRGHNRVSHLAARVRAIDAEDQRRAHDARMAEPIDPRVAAILSRNTGPTRAHPNRHAFLRGPEPNTCAVPGCGGPIGVHVRIVALDDEGHATVVASGAARS